MKKIISTIALLAFVSFGFAQKAENIILKVENFNTYNVTLKPEKYKGKEALAAEQTTTRDSDRQYTFAGLKNFEFHNGTIEVELTGEPKKDAIEGARGFVGIAFRVAQDTSAFECFYLRPTNARAEDQVRRNHSVQYISHPGFPWRKLRSETPEKYETYTDLVAGEWTKLKIEVKDDKAKLFVNGAEQPTLLVNDLKQGKDKKGSVALWIDIGTLARFANLKITKWD